MGAELIRLLAEEFGVPPEGSSYSSRHGRGGCGLKARVSVLRTLVPELPRASRSLTVAAAACILVGAILPVGFAIASGAAVGAVPGAVAGGLASDQGRRLINAVIAVSLLFAVSQALLSGAQRNSRLMLTEIRVRN